VYEVFSSTEGGTKVSLLDIVDWYLLLLVVGKPVRNVQEIFFYARLISNNARIWKATRLKYYLSGTIT
jgi:hypothetical protein